MSALADDVGEATEHVVVQSEVECLAQGVQRWVHSEDLQVSHEVLVDSYQIFKLVLCKVAQPVEDLLTWQQPVHDKHVLT
jgi:hypothetical protein